MIDTNEIQDMESGYGRAEKVSRWRMRVEHGSDLLWGRKNIQRYLVVVEG